MVVIPFFGGTDGYIENVWRLILFFSLISWNLTIFGLYLVEFMRNKENKISLCPINFIKLKLEYLDIIIKFNKKYKILFKNLS